MRRRIGVLLCFGLALLTGAARGQQPDTAASRIRRLVIRDDYESAILAGQALARRGVESVEAQSWTVVALASSRMTDAALDTASILRRQHPADVRAEYAYAFALLQAQDPQALQVVTRARVLAPWDPSLIALNAQILASLSQGIDRAAAVALLDSTVLRCPPNRALWLARAGVEIRSRNMDLDAARRAGAAADEALKLDSADVDAWAIKRDVAKRLGRPDDGLAAARHAVDAAPTSVRAHEMLWAETRQIRGITPEEARQQILSDADSLAKRRGRTPGLLQALAGLYRDIGMPEQRAAAIAELRRTYPSSFEVEAIESDSLSRMWVALRRPGVDQAMIRAKIRQEANAFIAAPHRTPRGLGHANGLLMAVLMQDTSSPPAELARAAEGANRYHDPLASSMSYDVAIRLAGHAGTRAAAERIARAIPASFDATVGRMFFVAAGGSTTSKEPGARAAERRRTVGMFRQYTRSGMHDALGWIRFNAGQLAAARAQLDSARLLAPEDPRVLYHLGRVAERQGRRAEAESFYIQGVAAESPNGNHPNREAVRRIFQLRDSTSAALDSLVARRAATARTTARDTILARRLKSPRPMPEFALPALAGGAFSSAALKGKIAVINFWGTWCKACLEDLLTIQKVYDHYRADPDVTVLTIGVEDDTAHAVERLGNVMKAHGLNFPVLVGDERIRTFVPVFPTTWYVDRQGRILYEDQDMWSSDFVKDVEPFVWRVESLKDSTR